jgi:hypothetical protein
MNTLIDWIVAGAASVLLAAIPTCSQAAPLPGGEEFCELVADSAQVAAKAREQGALLGQFKSRVDHSVDPHNVEMRDLLDKVGTIIYTSDDFAGLTSEQAMRKAYRACMSVPYE